MSEEKWLDSKKQRLQYDEETFKTLYLCEFPPEAYKLTTPTDNTNNHPKD